MARTPILDGLGYGRDWPAAFNDDYHPIAEANAVLVLRHAAPEWIKPPIDQATNGSNA
jgi:hypothetical protein